MLAICKVKNNNVYKQFNKIQEEVEEFRREIFSGVDTYKQIDECCDIMVSAGTALQDLCDKANIDIDTALEYHFKKIKEYEKLDKLEIVGKLIPAICISFDKE